MVEAEPAETVAEEAPKKTTRKRTAKKAVAEGEEAPKTTRKRTAKKTEAEAPVEEKPAGVPAE